MKKILSAIVCLCCLSAMALAGVQWASKVTSKEEKENEASVLTSVVYAQDGDVKQVFKDVPKNQKNVYLEDGYWLFKNKENTIYIVNDKEKTVTPMSVDTILRLTGFLGELVKIEISDYKVSSEALSSETVLGHPCQHLRIVSDYTMKVKIAIIKQTSFIHQEKEIWASPDAKFTDEVGQGFRQKEFKTGFNDLDELIEKEMKQSNFAGFPLKTVTRQVQTGKKGNLISDKTNTMEVLELKVQKFPAALFDVPKDYRLEQPLEQE